ncbi:hypothetical protein P872_18455 [Rhodonellum psychrophilum GCM71 = DSM 17998]|uniref:Portal protein n=2 Tax=Rhodonellum TaxID=336827 RepID=U5BXU4_9BACT|nr:MULTISPECIES: phage portal protein [Rhodonellum]ERM82379.1 hypothetical protein P872_18455 [Rhodonellum psychrophilum GCM71 = DSM 17998]SDZ35521.1 phage portal protein, HK97 family [Rhodonellum ikkaensis]
MNKGNKFEFLKDTSVRYFNIENDVPVNNNITEDRTYPTNFLSPSILSLNDFTANGTVVNEKTALTIASFYQGINIIANTISTLPMKVHRGKEVDKNNIIYYLLKEKPNKYQTAFEWINTMLLIMITKGNSFSFIKRDNSGDIYELNIINYTYVEAVIFDDVLFFKFDGDKDLVYRNDEVIHFKNIGTGYLGINPILNFKKNLEVNLNTVEYTNKIYNGEASSLRGTITYDKALNDKQREVLRGELSTNFSGPNGKRILFLEDGMKLDATKLDPASTKFLESRLFEKSEIASMLNLPLFLLNGDSGTNQNIEFNNIRFYQTTLLPIISKIEQELKTKLFSKQEIVFDDLHIKINVNSLLRGDTKARADFYKQLFYLSAISPEEIRDLEDMPNEIKGKTFVQANLIPSDLVNDFWDSKAKLDISKANDLNNTENEE